MEFRILSVWVTALVFISEYAYGQEQNTKIVIMKNKLSK